MSTAKPREHREAHSLNTPYLNPFYHPLVLANMHICRPNFIGICIQVPNAKCVAVVKNNNETITKMLYYLQNNHVNIQGFQGRTWLPLQPTCIDLATRLTWPMLISVGRIFLSAKFKFHILRVSLKCNQSLSQL